MQVSGVGPPGPPQLPAGGGESGSGEPVRVPASLAAAQPLRLQDG